MPKKKFVVSGGGKEKMPPFRDSRKVREENKGLPRIYVIHEHHASHLHWDLRLQIKGVLKSWAIPKKPPLSVGIKRLAIQVEDHLLSYADFEGEIPEPQYGAGKVKIWDKGELKVEELEPNKIVFNLRGRRLIGKYALIKPQNKFRARPPRRSQSNETKFKDNPEKSWLFMRVE